MPRAKDSAANEKLVPNGAESSTSPSHSLPTYEGDLPGVPGPEGAPPAGMGMSSTSSATHTAIPPCSSLTEVATMPSAQLAAPALASGGGSSTMAAMEIQETLLPPQPPVAFEHPISVGRRRWMVAMFCVVAALLFADQNLLAPNLTEAAEFFGMTEQQKDTLLGGALMAAFFAVGAPAALLVGWLADRGDVNRRSLLFWVVVVGETPCLLTYWVKEFWQFFLLRSLTGIAVGGCFPLVFSLLGDLFPPRKRAAVSAVVQIATGAGIAVGQALSGSIGPATNWRVPFVVVAAPSLVVALVMQLTTTEPPRGAFEEALQERYAEGSSYEGSISWAKVRTLLRCPSNALVIAQGLPGSLPWGMVLTYFNDFMSQQKGFTVQAATLVLLLFGAGGAVGVILGGALGQWLYNKQKEYQALLAGGCVLLGIAPLYVLINADLQAMGLGGTCVLSAIGGAVASVAGPNLRSVMLNVNEPETRGVALALQSMTDDLGKGLGPVMVAGLIHALGRTGAFNVATAGWVPCAIMLTSLACCMRKDEAAMQARLAKASEDAAAASAAAQAEAGGAGAGITVPLASWSGGGQHDIVPVAAAPPGGNERQQAKIRLLEGCGESSSGVGSAPPLLGPAAGAETGSGGAPHSSSLPRAAAPPATAAAGLHVAAAHMELGRQQQVNGHEERLDSLVGGAGLQLPVSAAASGDGFVAAAAQQWGAPLISSGSVGTQR
ncbi:hypothetical protein HYH02_007785 [Chlamydomonas schloesseri]|uniref:Major facilitator superfamily (MFS) profile domain-containing protein n=1 Tax=Chlamydomonas schloesseri TaxID=2026947 RepID=A0A835WH18_9CHLO|nr:hypothetical protein HYH02_007785 [Chlamydomonas schloesseri]|eukprot:KAG2447464.1 hypothetical protein HYH02_007785 [Chlamydomonas schloesseri]